MGFLVRLERGLLISLVLMVAVWVARRWPTSQWQAPAMFGVGKGTTAPSADGPQRSKRGRVLSVREALDIVDKTGEREAPLTEANLELLLQLAGANPTKAGARAHAERLQGEGLRIITPEVLERVLSTFREDGSELAQAWDVIDTNADGKVAGEEVGALKTMLTTLGEPLSEASLPCALNTPRVPLRRKPLFCVSVCCAVTSSSSAPQEETAQLLGDMDGNGDGEISREEFMELLQPS